MFNKFILSLLIIIIVSPLVFLWVTYTNEVVTADEAYGFTIGESKAEVYQKAPVLLSEISTAGHPIFIQFQVTESSAPILAVNPEYTIMVQTLLHDIGFSTFETLDTWDFYFGGTYSNGIRLTFCNNKLCEIYRHKKYFEIP